MLELKKWALECCDVKAGRRAQTDVCKDACNRETHSKTRKLKLLKLDAVILPTNREELNTEKVSQQAIISWMSPVKAQRTAVPMM